MSTTITTARLENFNKLRIWESFSPVTHVKELTVEKATRMFNLKTPAAVDNFYAWSHKQKLTHVCRELNTAFGPDNYLDRLLRLSRGEMSDTASLVGPKIHLPNITHSLVDAMPLPDATLLPELDWVPLVDVMVPMSWLFQAPPF